MVNRIDALVVRIIDVPFINQQVFRHDDATAKNDIPVGLIIPLHASFTVG